MKTSEALLCIIDQEGGQIDALALSSKLQQLAEAGYIESLITDDGNHILKLTDQAIQYLKRKGLKL